MKFFGQLPVERKEELMKIIICLDNENGMMFHGRRLSQDRLLRKDILKELGNGKLWMNEYSAKMFADDQNKNIMVSEEFLSQAGNQEFCFVENVPLFAIEAQIEQLIIYRWNRSYPSDQKLDLDLEQWKMTGTVEFSGSSHEKITKEIYEKQIRGEMMSVSVEVPGGY